VSLKRGAEMPQILAAHGGRRNAPHEMGVRSCNSAPIPFVNHFVSNTGIPSLCSRRREHAGISGEGQVRALDFFPFKHLFLPCTLLSTQPESIFASKVSRLCEQGQQALRARSAGGDRWPPDRWPPFALLSGRACVDGQGRAGGLVRRGLLEVLVQASGFKRGRGWGGFISHTLRGNTHHTHYEGAAHNPLSIHYASHAAQHAPSRARGERAAVCACCHREAPCATRG
jgi:hypothetical protein